MCCTCFNVQHMAMIQIRNVPEGLHRKLKARAAKQGKSLSDYLLGEISEVAEMPTLEEMFERLEQRSAENPVPTPTEMIREERDSR
jgi:antitoxin FitA